MRDWLKKLRIANGFTQQELADLAGISRAYYSRIESGLRRPSPEIAQIIANILNFDWRLFFEAVENVS